MRARLATPLYEFFHALRGPDLEHTWPELDCQWLKLNFTKWERFSADTDLVYESVLAGTRRKGLR
jgi:hypothetical protein